MDLLATAAQLPDPQMALAFLGTLLGMLALGALQGGISAATSSAQARAEAQVQGRRRARLNQLIKRIRNPDYSGVEAAQSRDFTRAVQAAEAQAAQGNVFNTPGAQGRSDNIMAEMMADLARFKIQDEAERNRTIAGLLQDQAFSSLPPEAINVGLNALLGTLTGAAGGAAQAVGDRIAHPEAFDKPAEPATKDSKITIETSEPHTAGGSLQLGGLLGALGPSNRNFLID